MTLIPSQIDHFAPLVGLTFNALDVHCSEADKSVEVQVRLVGSKAKKSSYQLKQMDEVWKISGLALAVVGTRPLNFSSSATFVDYLKAYDRRQSLNEQKKKLADEVDKLLAHKLMGEFVMDLSEKEATAFLEKLKPGSIKATLVRPSYEDPTGFYVSRRVGGANSKKIEHLFFQVAFTPKGQGQGAIEIKAERHCSDKKHHVTISNVSCFQKYLSFFEVEEAKLQGQSVTKSGIDPEFL